MGASFCQVKRIRPDSRGVPCVTSGTQKWNGLRPSFMVRAIIARVVDKLKLKLSIDHWPENMIFVITANIKIIDAVAWIRKYLVAASVDRGLALLIITGIIDSMLISKPTQISNQWRLRRTIIVPEIKVMKIVVAVKGFISTGRV